MSWWLDMAVAGGVFQNWKIENFSCWNKDVHDKFIKSPPLFSSNCKCMKLYPRGISGDDEHLVVRFSDIKNRFSGGELSFIGSDGSIICTLHVVRDDSRNLLDSPLGPKYEDVAQIGKKELTVRFIPSIGEIYEQRMCTSIDVVKISLEIDKKCIVESVEESDGEKLVLFNSCTDIENNELIVFNVTCEDERMQLILQPICEDSKILMVESRLRLLSPNGTLVRYEENKHVFGNVKPWTFSDSLKFNEVVDRGYSLKICFKICKGNLTKKYNHVLLGPEGVGIMLLNTDGCVPEEKIGDGLKCPSSKGTGDSMTKPITQDYSNRDASNQPENSSVSALTKELNCLLKDRDFSDLQLKCDSVTFPVHKAILSARSPVFKRMLANDMREAASNEVDIEDMDPSTLALFLAFLYTGGSVEGLLQGESALKLYYAADKYQVPTLKRECAGVLSSDVSVSNVCDVLSLADQHGDDLLISAARDFILNNLNEVSRSEQWKDFMKSRPLLAVQTMTHFTAKDFVVRNPQ